MRNLRIATFLVLAGAGACARSSSVPSPEGRAAAPAPRPTGLAAWEGTYDLVGRDFPTSTGPADRTGVIAITRADTGYAFSMVDGPPGRATSVRTAGDSLIVDFELQETPTPLRIALAFTDSGGAAAGERAVAGEWVMGADRGAITGKRRP